MVWPWASDYIWGSSIASQSRINRGSIADLSITNMETRSTKRLTLQKVTWLPIKKETVIDRAKPSTQDCSILQIWTAILQRMSFSIYTIDDGINRIPIADQSRCSVLQSRMSRYEGRFIILRCAFAIGAHVQKLHSCIMSLYRRVAFGHWGIVARSWKDETVQSRLSLPNPLHLLHVHRLRYLQHLVRSGDPTLWAMLQQRDYWWKAGGRQYGLAPEQFATPTPEGSCMTDWTSWEFLLQRPVEVGTTCSRRPLSMLRCRTVNK